MVDKPLVWAHDAHLRTDAISTPTCRSLTKVEVKHFQHATIFRRANALSSLLCAGLRRDRFIARLIYTSGSGLSISVV